MSDKLTPEREAELYPQVMRFAREKPWAILRSSSQWHAICEVLALRSRGIRFTPDEIQARVGDRGGQRDFQMAGPVAVLPVYGVLIPRADAFTEMSGGSSVQRLQATFAGLVEDDNVSAIVLDVESPGGSTALIPEFAAEIRAARGSKPIVAVANTRAASAAYHLAAQADEIVVTKSGDVGSIGTFAIHEDISKALEAEGITITEIASSPEKVETSPFKPLSEEGQAEIKRRVDESQAMFESDVAKGRRVSIETVRSDFGNGRMVSAKRAVEVGMADRIDTLEATVQRLARTRNVQVEPNEPDPVEPGDLGATQGSGRTISVEFTGNAANIRNLGTALGPTFAQEALALRDSADSLVNRMASLAEVERGSLTRAKRDALAACPAALRESADAITSVLERTDPDRGTELDEMSELELAYLARNGK